MTNYKILDNCGCYGKGLVQSFYLKYSINSYLYLIFISFKHETTV